MTGTKHYLGPFEAYGQAAAETPFRENAPRLPGLNFYYTQDTTYINDVRFDLRQGKAGVAYITDSSGNGPGGIIVVDIDSGESWRKLSGHSSTAPEAGFIPIVEGERWAIREKGKPPAAFNASSDGIALSNHGATLYYCPLSSRHLFSVPSMSLSRRKTSL